jgi:chromosome segregation ATPase
MNTLLQQYEKLKESQLSLLAMNKQMLVSHQKEVSELQQNLSAVKTELRAKTEKVETYQEIMKSFNGQINEFEEFQQNSQRDMNTLSEQYKLYKELYEKESMQKQLLIKKLQSGKLKVPTTYKQTADSGKQTK